MIRLITGRLTLILGLIILFQNISFSQTPKKTNYDLEDRLLEFAVAVVELTDDLPNTRAGNHIAGQPLRCGTSTYSHHGWYHGSGR